MSVEERGKIPEMAAPGSGSEKNGADGGGRHAGLHRLGG